MDSGRWYPEAEVLPVHVEREFTDNEIADLFDGTVEASIKGALPPDAVEKKEEDTKGDCLEEEREALRMHRELYEWTAQPSALSKQRLEDILRCLVDKIPDPVKSRVLLSKIIPRDFTVGTRICYRTKCGWKTGQAAGFSRKYAHLVHVLDESGDFVHRRVPISLIRKPLDTPEEVANYHSVLFRQLEKLWANLDKLPTAVKQIVQSLGKAKAQGMLRAQFPKTFFDKVQTIGVLAITRPQTEPDKQPLLYKEGWKGPVLIGRKQLKYTDMKAAEKKWEEEWENWNATLPTPWKGLPDLSAPEPYIPTTPGRDEAVERRDPASCWAERAPETSPEMCPSPEKEEPEDYKPLPGPQKLPSFSSSSGSGCRKRRRDRSGGSHRGNRRRRDASASSYSTSSSSSSSSSTSTVTSTSVHHAPAPKQTQFSSARDDCSEIASLLQYGASPEQLKTLLKVLRPGQFFQPADSVREKASHDAWTGPAHPPHPPREPLGRGRRRGRNPSYRQ